MDARYLHHLNGGGAWTVRAQDATRSDAGPLLATPLQAFVQTGRLAGSEGRVDRVGVGSVYIRTCREARRIVIFARDDPEGP
jgi:hypothetical protein